MSGVLGGILCSATPSAQAGDGLSVEDTNVGTATAAVVFENDGDITSTITSGSTDAGDWVSPKAAASQVTAAGWTVRAHVNSGSLFGGSAAVDTDLALSSSRTWIVSQTGSGNASANLTITIKNGAGNTLATGTITLSASVP